MSLIEVSKFKFGDSLENFALPTNKFNIKEGNTRIGIRSVLRDHPETRDFSNQLQVIDETPTTNEITFDFGSIDLTLEQENISLAVIESFRDKDSFTELEQLSKDNFELIQETLEVLDDVFDEDTINDIDVVDICDIRNQFKELYNANEWDFFNIGEKRILIADWIIPTIDERKTVFQGAAKRSSIYRLFSSSMINLKKAQEFVDIADIADNYELDDFDLFFKRAFSPSKTRFTNEVFISRSNAASDDATVDAKLIPVFGNVRTISSLVSVIDDFTGEIQKDGLFEIEYSSSITTANNKNWRIGVLENNSDIDGQGMKRDSRGRTSVSHPRIRVELKKGDLINLQLAPVNNNTSALTALNGKSLIRIEEVLK